MNACSIILKWQANTWCQDMNMCRAFIVNTIIEGKICHELREYVSETEAKYTDQHETDASSDDCDLSMPPNPFGVFDDSAWTLNETLNP